MSDGRTSGKVSQALVAIGGKACRIRRDGVDVPISKSFITVCGFPLLYWNLLSLHAAGIRRLILCGDQTLQLQEADMLLGLLGARFDEVKLFQDPGLGVHGLPYQVLEREPDLLDRDFLFECGHSFMTPDHYRQICAAKVAGKIVFSLFEVHPDNLRQPVHLRHDGVILSTGETPGRYALAHPMVIDTAYAELLPDLRFTVSQVIEHYLAAGQLDFARSTMPPEFDILAEMNAAMPQYESYIHACSPWQDMMPFASLPLLSEPA